MYHFAFQVSFDFSSVFQDNPKQIFKHAGNQHRVIGMTQIPFKVKE